MTLKVIGSNYLTVGYTLGDFFQAYVQHRAFNSRRAAAAAGVGIRREYLTFQVPCEGIGCGPEKLMYSVGIRGFGLLRRANSRRNGFKVGTYAGYIPYVQHPVVSVSLTVGGF